MIGKRAAKFLLVLVALVSVGLATGGAVDRSVPYCVSSPLYAQPHCYATATDAAQDHGDSIAP